MKWRILGWLALIVSLLCFSVGVFPLLVPEFEMNSIVEWDYVPFRLIAPLWFCENVIFVPAAGVAFSFASYSFFRKNRGRSFGWPSIAYVTIATISSLIYLGSKILLTTADNFSIAPNTYMSVPFSSTLWSVAYAIAVVGPAWFMRERR